MIYDPEIANITREEFDALLAVVRSKPDAPATDEDRWRHDHQELQRRKRIVGHQQDLFGGTTITRYRRNEPAPEWDRPPVETVAQKLERIRDDPLATFGPPRSDRPAFPTDRQRAAIVRRAANWLRVGQPVRLIDAPGSVDPVFGIQRFLGRTGVVWRLCGSTFADRCYVFFDPVGGERRDKIEMVELRDLEPLA